MVTLLYISLLAWSVSLFPKGIYGPLFTAWVLVAPLKSTLIHEGFGFQLFDPIVVLALMTIGALFSAKLSEIKNILWIHKFIIGTHLLFAFWVCLSLLWSPSLSYGSYKAYRFLILNTLLLMSPIILLKKVSDFETMAGWTLVFIVIVYLKISIFPAYDGLDGSLKSGRAGFGFGEESATAGVCIASAYAFHKIFKTQRKLLQTCYLFSIAVLLYGAMMAGTRTVIFSILMTPILMITFTPRDIWRKSWLFPMLICGAVILFVFAITPDQQFGRFTDSAQGDESIFTRFLHWQQALKAFTLHPLIGLGIGGYSFFDTGLDLRWFCHNIFLETMSELGIIGTILFIIMLILVGILISRNWLQVGYLSRGSTKNLSWFPFSCVIFITYFLQTLVTDDLADNRWLWLNIGLIISTTVPRGTHPIEAKIK